MNNSLQNKKMLDRPITYPWPIITKEIEEAVIKQLHRTLGTYDRSDITKEFEDDFKNLHNMKYALVTSSGTAALHSAYYALNFKPLDEVICPNYTFFATATPLFQLGLLPVLADCDKKGSIDPIAIKKLITKKTKAIAITHMWGYPCDMDEIKKICKEFNLYLIEDCSHAHGAKYKNQLVGTFGDIGIFSMQSQKIIAAGEAGILITNNKKFYDRAQLLGHFNKRALNEIDKESEEYKYASTGTGLKYRPSALSLAIAKCHLKYLTTWIENKNINAKRLENLISNTKGIKPLFTISDDIKPAYYAFCFTVDETCKYTKEEIVNFFHYNNFLDIDIPKSTTGLDKYYLFQNPISPVINYDEKCIRTSYPNSLWISNNLVKLSVPIDYLDTTFGKYFIDCFEKIWSNIF
jgi:dTDP-4-amino-4,6-dideoxygalactose transaminase